MTKKKIARSSKGTKPSDVTGQKRGVGASCAELIEAVLSTAKDYGAKVPDEAAPLLNHFARRLERAAEALQPRVEAAPNTSLVRNNKAFDGAEGIDPDATIGDLMHLLFEAPNRGPRGLLSDAKLCAADEADLISCAAVNGDGMLGDAISRVAFRVNWRVKVLMELDRRMRAAEQTAGGAS